MFNMQKCGSKICHLRKEKNLTQMELANMLGISYQAVSNWERGSAMPDISKLPELSQIFDISIDELLDNESGSKVIKSIVEGAMDTYIEENHIGLDALENIAPLVKSENMDAIIETAHLDNDYIETISVVAPSISEKLLSEKVSIRDVLDFENHLANLAPFMSKDILNKIALDYSKQGKINQLEDIAPFLSKDTLNEIALNCSRQGKINQLEDLAPFISKDTLTEIALNCCKQGKINQLEDIAPFLGSNVLNELILTYINK